MVEPPGGQFVERQDTKQVSDAQIDHDSAERTASIAAVQANMKALEENVKRVRELGIEGADTLTRELQELRDHHSSIFSSPHVDSTEPSNSTLNSEPFWMDRNRHFTIQQGEEIGKGATARVYKGTVIMATGEQAEVAVKVPYTTAHYSKERSEETMYTEERQLQMLRDTQKRLFPGSKLHFVYGRVTPFGGTQALVMELAPNESVGRFSYDKRGEFDRPAERAKSILIQGFEAIATAHEVGIYGIDRKGGDYKYDSEHDRLIILDWNVSANVTRPGESNESGGKKRDIVLTLQYLTESLEDLIPSAIRQKLDRIDERVKSPSCQTIDAKKILTLIRNIETVTPEQIMEAIPHQELEQWKKILLEKPELYSMIEELAGTGAVYGTQEKGSPVPRLLEDTYTPEQQPFVDFVRFTSAVADLRFGNPLVDAEYPWDWRQEFHAGTIAYLKNPSSVDMPTRERLREKVRQLMQDSHLQSARLLLPAPLLDLIMTD